VVLVAVEAEDSAESGEWADESEGLDGKKPRFALTEVATFRSDGAYSDGRRPDAVRYTQSAEEDVRRRDFTINGLLLDPQALARTVPQALKPGESEDRNVGAEAHTHQGVVHLSGAEETPEKLPVLKGHDFSRAADGAKTSRALAPEGSFSGITPPILALSAAFEAFPLEDAVIDHVGGLADLEAGVVRAIGRAELRFEEDRLRMLRGVRFAARFGFALEAETAAAMRRLAAKTETVSRERVRDELTRMLTEGHARRAFELLDETGLLAEVLPEVARMKGVEQPPQFHPEGDVWTHTLLLLDQLEAGCPLTLAWGALLHDVGKPPTFQRLDRIRFNGHAEVGVVMTAEICRRFRFSNEETRQIVALVENHMRFMDAQRMKLATLKRFLRLQKFEEHLALHRMDCLAGSGYLENWEFVRERSLLMPEEAVRPRPLITGRELIAAGYRPGASFREMLRAVEDAQLEGAIGTAEEAMNLVRERFSASQGDFRMS
jgi:poly(A) polymerase